MEMFNKYKSPLGYQVGENHIDTYGVDHSGFSTRDELAYQMARQQRAPTFGATHLTTTLASVLRKYPQILRICKTHRYPILAPNL